MSIYLFQSKKTLSATTEGIAKQAELLKHNLDTAFTPDVTRVGGGPTAPTYPHSIDPFLSKEVQAARTKIEDNEEFYILVCWLQLSHDTTVF